MSAAVAASASQPASSVEYAYIGTDGGIYQYRVLNSGALMPLHPKLVHVNAEPGDYLHLVPDPRRHTLYAAASHIWQFRINANGTLKPLPKPAVRVKAEIDTEAVALDPSGNNFYAGSNQLGLLRFRVLPNGELKLAQTLATSPADVVSDQSITDMQVDPVSKTLYLSRRLGRAKLLLYHIHADGTLTPGPIVTPPGEQGSICSLDVPRRLLFASGAGTLPCPYRITANGSLQCLHPGGIALLEGASAPVTFDWSGRYAFVAIHTQPSSPARISIFRVQPDGQLLPVVIFASPGIEGAIPTVDPTGRALYTIYTYEENVIALNAYRIEPSMGGRPPGLRLIGDMSRFHEFVFVSDHPVFVVLSSRTVASGHSRNSRRYFTGAAGHNR